MLILDQKEEQNLKEKDERERERNWSRGTQPFLGSIPILRASRASRNLHTVGTVQTLAQIQPTKTGTLFKPRYKSFLVLQVVLRRVC